MHNNAGAILIRMATAMTANTKSLAATLHMPRWAIPRLFGSDRRRRQATIDLIHSSPHLLRDIGAIDHALPKRGK